MLKLVLLGAVAVPVIAAGTVAATGVVVVDVKEPREGHHIVVPVPLALAQVAAGFVPEDKMRLRIPPHAQAYLPAARQALAALAASEDAEIVHVEEPGQTVSVRKEGALLHVEVHERDEQVDVRVPIAVALSALPDAGGRVTASDLVWSLQHARLTRIADVQGRDGEHVTVTVY